MLHDAATNDLKKRGIPVDWVAPGEGTPILDQVVQVTRGSKNKELAWKFIDAYLSPEVQLAFATELFWSPTNRTVKVPPDVAKKVIGPADVEKLVLFDWAHGGQAAAAVDREVEPGDALTEAPGAAGTVTLTGLVKRYGTTLALDGVSLAIVPGEFFTLLGPSGLRQDHHAALGGGLRDAGRRPRSPSTGPTSPGCPRTGGASAWCSSTTRSFRTAPSRRTWASACACSGWTEGGDRAAGGRGARARAAPRPRRALSGPALGRRAAAGGAGARAGHAARGAPAGRAAGRARQEAARPHEDRAQAPAARGRHHHDLRDARPGGGAHHVRPHRGDAPRARRAGGHAARALRGRPRPRSWPASSATSISCRAARPGRTRWPAAAPRSRPPARRRPAPPWRSRCARSGSGSTPPRALDTVLP